MRHLKAGVKLGRDAAHRRVCISSIQTGNVNIHEIYMVLVVCCILLWRRVDTRLVFAMAYVSGHPMYPCSLPLLPSVQALFRNQVTQLVKHDKIVTTLPKARAIRKVCPGFRTHTRLQSTAYSARCACSVCPAVLPLQLSAIFQLCRALVALLLCAACGLDGNTC
jgi:ribosomal L17-like protein